MYKKINKTIPTLNIDKTDIYGYPRIPRGDGKSDYYYESLRDIEQNLVCDKRDKPFVSSPHIHSCFEFMYCVNGYIDGCIDDVSFRLRPGQLAAVSSFVTHEYESYDADALLLIIPRRLAVGYEKTFERHSFDKVVVDDDEQYTLLHQLRAIYSIHRRLGCCSGMDGIAYEQLIASVCSAFLGLAVYCCGLRENIAVNSSLIGALDYIHSHYNEEIRIPELARLMLCSQQTLSDQFRELFGMTIKSYINHLRANAVCTMLSTDASLTLSEATERAGFGSIRSMLRAYRREYDCTPSENR